ncbi:MAG TPA: glycosyltransferase family 4 protein, partial [Planctomycetota bacterium]|nr:glycosyltransferase family 4 protein [Planctomycetota bacterium]
GVKESPTRDRRFRRSVRTADAVITPNETLADHARRARPEEPDRIHVIPTVIDLARWSVRPAGGEAGKAVIGWMGTPQNLQSMELLRQPLARLCRRFDHVGVKIVCDAPMPMENVRLAHKPFSAADEVADVQSFDIAVAPLVEDPWTRGKTSTKILAYFAAGVPVVASDVSANRLYVRDGENGFLAGTLQHWEERLAKLIDDPALRAAVGAKARETVEKDFSLESAVPKYLALFEKLRSS